jgi:hypothetical protein
MHSAIPGQESLNDYPGPRGLVEQLDRGIPIAHQPAKVRKALEQLDKQEKMWAQSLLNESTLQYSHL